mmetsp:Transcript_30149/g.79670  ORF Transcript_30149/g.79670 Transcript_30149/m.79670 type:complete len:106 (-) Transcript_30149:76-393(-)
MTQRAKTKGVLCVSELTSGLDVSAAADCSDRIRRRVRQRFSADTPSDTLREGEADPCIPPADPESRKTDSQCVLQQSTKTETVGGSDSLALLRTNLGTFGQAIKN